MTFEDTLRQMIREELRADRKQHDAELIERIKETIGVVARPEYARPRKAAALVDFSAQTVRMWIKEGRLKQYRIQGQFRVRLSELEALIANTAPNELNDDELEARAGVLLAEMQGRS